MKTDKRYVELGFALSKTSFRMPVNYKLDIDEYFCKYGLTFGDENSLGLK